MQTAKTDQTGPEFSLDAQVILLVLLCDCSYDSDYRHPSRLAPIKF